jgi:mRNA interferase MazF
MKRGEIYFANLDPTVGSEIRKMRPVLVVSCNANNKFAPTLTVVPLTSNTSKVYPVEVLLEMASTGLSKRSKAQCHQIRTISKLRVNGKAVGIVDEKIMKLTENAIMLHLGLC